jgi:hypothetical protein
MLTRRVVRSILLEPSLWPAALAATFALAPRGWWRRPPFLPRPDPAVLEWRVATAYGSSEATVEPGDVIAYLRWRRRSGGR